MSQAQTGEAARKLFESERSFRLLVEGVTDYAIYMLDTTGRVVSWNSGAQRIKGYEAPEVIGQHFSVFYTDEDRAAGIPETALRTAREQGKFEAEGWRVRKDGSQFRAFVVIDPIYEDRHLIGYAKITRDVTERHQAQTRLVESERQFRLLVSGVTDYALYMLDPEGRITSWNQGGVNIKGYAPQEIIGGHFSRFYTEPDRENGKPMRALSIAETTGRYEEEGWRVRKDGSFFWASVVIDAIRDDDGNLIGYAKITRDITERRNAQNTLSKVERQLAEARKMDALGQLTGGIAHDFNNLLMIVSGHLHTIKRSVGDDPKLKRAAQAIEIATQRGATLTNQLLTFARRQRLNPEPVNLGNRIQGFRDVLASGLGSNVNLLIDVPPGIWPIMIDPNEFEMTLVNLVINARDAMPDGGTAIVSARNVSKDGRDFVSISVNDTGTGIAPDVLSKIFDPFFTTKSVGKGTGLGLSQVHGFVHQVGGSIDVTSRVGAGTTITMTFPRSDGVAADNAAAPADYKAGGMGTILLVEDNPDVAGVSTDLLEQLGYAVRWAPDARAALSEIEKSGIDLVFSDIVMPGGMDGLSLAQKIKQMNPGLPVVLTTGYSDNARVQRSEFPILQKPYQIHDLSRILAEALR